MCLNPEIKMNDKCRFVFVKLAADDSMSLPFDVWMYDLPSLFSILYHDTHEAKRAVHACQYPIAEAETELPDPLKYAPLSRKSEVCYPNSHSVCNIIVAARNAPQFPRNNSTHRVSSWDTCILALCLEFLVCTLCMSIFSILHNRRCGAQGDPTKEHESCPFAGFKCVFMQAHSNRISDRKHDLDPGTRGWRSCFSNTSHVFLVVNEGKTNLHPSCTQGCITLLQKFYDLRVPTMEDAYEGQYASLQRNSEVYSPYSPFNVGAGVSALCDFINLCGCFESQPCGWRTTFKSFHRLNPVLCKVSAIFHPENFSYARCTPSHSVTALPRYNLFHGTISKQAPMFFCYTGPPILCSPRHRQRNLMHEWSYYRL